MAEYAKDFYHFQEICASNVGAVWCGRQLKRPRYQDFPTGIPESGCLQQAIPAKCLPE